jgi:RimJ/RimL family protein N-acetyltransferase
VRRWELEVADPDIACFVVQRDGEVVGFAAVQDDEVLHFGIALEQWGTGLAVAAHDELLQVLGRSGHDLVRLHVYADNDRGRRFWEKCGWRANGERCRGTFPPYAELLTYERSLA